MRLFTMFIIAAPVVFSLFSAGVMAEPPLIRKNVTDSTTTEWGAFK